MKREPVYYVTFRNPKYAGFLQRVQIRSPRECWLWTGSTRGRNKFRYGGIYFEGKHWSAHRLAWVIKNGPIPRVIKGIDGRGVCVLHRCDTPLCVNPNHLFLGTHRTNMEDVAKKKRGCRHKHFCVNGHRRTKETLYVSKRGFRACRICHRNTERQRRKKEQRAF